MLSDRIQIFPSFQFLAYSQLRSMLTTHHDYVYMHVDAHSVPLQIETWLDHSMIYSLLYFPGLDFLLVSIFHSSLKYRICLTSVVSLIFYIYSSWIQVSLSQHTDSSINTNLVLLCETVLFDSFWSSLGEEIRSVPPYPISLLFSLISNDLPGSSNTGLLCWLSCSSAQSLIS